jgi:nicotinamide-nucleotide amidase
LDEGGHYYHYATYVKPDGIYLRITAKAQEKIEAQQMIAQSEVDIRETLTPYIWGVDDDTLEAITGDLLRTKKLSLATMESCTDGLLGNTIASSSGSPSYFKGGLVACCDEAKMAFGIDTRLIESYGKESSQIAEAMTEVVRKNLKADIGVGIAGTVNLGEKKGNIFIALIGDRFNRTIARTLLGNRMRVKQRAIYIALFGLRKILLEEV